MRITIKIGTSVLLGKKSLKSSTVQKLPLDETILKKIVEQIAPLYKQGIKIILVTSGAVASGASIVGKRSFSRLALSAIGQAQLIYRYISLFELYKIPIAQILLSAEVFIDRKRYEQFRTTLYNLEKIRALPIINENDVITSQTSFWDNDSLAAMVAILTKAQKLIFLTNVSGLYSAVPDEDANARVIKEVENISASIEKMGSAKTSLYGTGGMLSKLKSAKLAASCGIDSYIINGLAKNCITDLIVKNKKIGTHFLADKNQTLTDRERWILIGSISKNKIFVDRGAREALQQRKSLLAVGIIRVSGTFKQGDFINIADSSGEVFALAMVNYGSKDLIKLNTQPRTPAIKKYFQKVVVHANNLTLIGIR